MKQIIYVLFVFDLDGECKTKKQSVIVIKEICSWRPPWLGEYQTLYTGVLIMSVSLIVPEKPRGNKKV